MKQKSRYSVVFINVMVALILAFIVNISFFLFAGELNARKVPFPFPNAYIWIQIGYTFFISFVAVTVMTNKQLSFLKKTMFTIVVLVILFMFTPVHNRRGEWFMLFNSQIPFRFLQVPMLNVSFVLVASVLYGKIFELVYQKQRISIENEQLKNENLQTRYNMLANQISPHFLFNSLNSLSLLVREDEKDKALHYLDKLADTFRYMLQTGQSELTTLADELHFSDAYLYLHMIRYENKLFCDIDVDPRYLSWKLPSMSLQPLIENAVKHNSITLANPLHISIRTEGGSLIVSNPIHSKIDNSSGTNIGLKNLASRYQLLTQHEVSIINDGNVFEVVLPLIK